MYENIDGAWALVWLSGLCGMSGVIRLSILELEVGSGCMGGVIIYFPEYSRTNKVIFNEYPCLKY